jgi:hypothetical protein
MPFPAKVHVLNAEVGGRQEIEAGPGPQDGAVIADAAEHGLVPAGEGQLADTLDQLSFRTHQGFKYI